MQPKSPTISHTYLYQKYLSQDSPSQCYNSRFIHEDLLNINIQQHSLHMAEIEDGKQKNSLPEEEITSINKTVLHSICQQSGRAFKRGFRFESGEINGIIPCHLEKLEFN